MAYEFKKLSEVNVIESISDTLNVLVEDNGEVVKIAANNLVPEDVIVQSEMEAAIAAIGTAPVVEELAENAHVLVEQDGAYARVPKDKVGGGFIATFELSSDGSTAACDKTFAECEAAFENDTLDARYIMHHEADMMMSENTSKGKMCDVSLGTFSDGGNQIMEFVFVRGASENVIIDYLDDGTINVMSS